MASEPMRPIRLAPVRRGPIPPCVWHRRSFWTWAAYERHIREDHPQWHAARDQRDAGDRA